MTNLYQTPPRFISFEGTEGVGKTTAMDGFCDVLTAQNVPFVRTREPGGSKLGETLRTLLLDKNSRLHDDTELLLMFAARSDHLHQVILPALANGHWVICDRFIDSTVAYQGFGRYFGDRKQLDKIQSLIHNFVPKLPDLTFWLDMDIKKGMERAQKRSQADRFESNDLAFFERVYQGFVHQHTHHNRITQIHADDSIQGVQNQLWQALKQHLSRLGV